MAFTSKGSVESGESLSRCATHHWPRVSLETDQRLRARDRRHQSGYHGRAGDLDSSGGWHRAREDSLGLTCESHRCICALFATAVIFVRSSSSTGRIDILLFGAVDWRTWNAQKSLRCVRSHLGLRLASFRSVRARRQEHRFFTRFINLQTVKSEGRRSVAEPRWIDCRGRRTVRANASATGRVPQGQVNDGDAVTLGQVMSEWILTVAILTESAEPCIQT